MTVKRYCSVLFDAGLIEMACGDYVTHSDYQKLVAENASMRKAIDETIGWQDSVDPGNAESVRLLVALQTPSTDAFTAELRAQGVDELANKLDGLPFNCGVNHQYVVSFAANLRAGRKG